MSVIVSAALVVLFFAAILIFLPPLFALAHGGLSGTWLIEKYDAWVEYWVDKSFEWE